MFLEKSSFAAAKQGNSKIRAPGIAPRPANPYPAKNHAPANVARK
jgi:hypothetical protein